jgi:hypothetical protein
MTANSKLRHCLRCLSQPFDANVLEGYVACVCLDSDIARERVLAERQPSQPQRQSWRIGYDIVSRICEVGRLGIVD